jgi:hypothetical protein
MLEGRVIRGVILDAASFRNAFKKLPPDIQVAARDRIKAMLFTPMDQIPAAWHMHQLTGREVPSIEDPKKKVKVWTIHLNTADTYKASFTLEDMHAYFRTCGEHDAVDKTP